MGLVEEKYLGSLLGIAIGDALGWPQERNKRSSERNRNTNFREWVKNSDMGSHILRKSYKQVVTVTIHNSH